MISDSFIKDLWDYSQKLMKRLGLKIDLNNNIHAQNDIEYVTSNGIPRFDESDIMNYVESHKLDDTQTMALIDLQNTMDLYWIWNNAIHFYTDIKRVKKQNYVYDVKLFKELNELGLEEFIFDFKGMDGVVKIAKSYDHLYRKGKEPLDMWGLTYSRYNYRAKGWASFEIILTEDKPFRAYHPVLLIDEPTSANRVCKECSICHEVDASIVAGFECDKKDTADTVMLIGRNLLHTTETACKLGKVIGFNPDMKDAYLSVDLYDIINACMYSIDKFIHRKTVARDIKKEIESAKEVSETVEIKVPKTLHEDNDTGLKFVNLYDYTSVERKHNRRVGTPNHHGSPREHYRRPTVRHLKSGKIVSVRGSVVNKGKEKRVVYKV